MPKRQISLAEKKHTHAAKMSYHIYSSKRRVAFLISLAPFAVGIRARCLFEVGVYFKTGGDKEFFLLIQQ